MFWVRAATFYRDSQSTLYCSHLSITIPTQTQITQTSKLYPRYHSHHPTHITLTYLSHHLLKSNITAFILFTLDKNYVHSQMACSLRMSNYMIVITDSDVWRGIFFGDSTYAIEVSRQIGFDCWLVIFKHRW